MDVVCSEGGMEGCVKLGGAANWIGGTGVVGGIFSIPPLLALLLSSFSYPFTVDLLRNVMSLFG
jgi:hypothetical protein